MKINVICFRSAPHREHAGENDGPVYDLAPIPTKEHDRVPWP